VPLVALTRREVLQALRSPFRLLVPSTDLCRYRKAVPGTNMLRTLVHMCFPISPLKFGGKGYDLTPPSTESPLSPQVNLVPGLVHLPAAQLNNGIPCIEPSCVVVTASFVSPPFLSSSSALVFLPIFLKAIFLATTCPKIKTRRPDQCLCYPWQDPNPPVGQSPALSARFLYRSASLSPLPLR